MQFYDNYHDLLDLEESCKSLTKRLANKVDINDFRLILFSLLFIRKACLEVPLGVVIPHNAQWRYLKICVDSPVFADIVFDAVSTFAERNIVLKGILLDVRKRQFSSSIVKSIFEFIDSVSFEPFKGIDLFSRISEFLHAGDKKNGHFFTPDCVAIIMTTMLQPKLGKIYDPCCGTGSLLKHCIDYMIKTGSDLRKVAIIGEEANESLYRICRMNLKLTHRKIDNKKIKWHPEGSLLKDDAEIKADFILANPPFNAGNWGWQQLKNDPRWVFGTPPANNSNLAWVQHVWSNLNNRGRAAIILSNACLVSQNPKEQRIRMRLVEEGAIDCIVTLPDRLFYNTNAPCCIWILNRRPKPRSKQEKILFIAADLSGQFINARQRVLTPDDIRTISRIYQKWLSKKGYMDIPGQCKSASIEEIREQEYRLLPGYYVGIEKEKPEDDETFNRKMKEISERIVANIKIGAEMDRKILEMMEELGFK